MAKNWKKQKKSALWPIWPKADFWQKLVKIFGQSRILAKFVNFWQDHRGVWWILSKIDNFVKIWNLGIFRVRGLTDFPKFLKFLNFLIF